MNFFDIMEYANLAKQVSPATMQGIESFGFSSLTEIQAQALPHLLEGMDLRGTAKTGSGKTLAFLIPAIEMLHRTEFKAKKGELLCHFSHFYIVYHAKYLKFVFSTNILV
mgnify:CR=1 FL=1